MRWRYIISTGNEIAFPYRSAEFDANDHFHMSPTREAFAKWRGKQVRRNPHPAELIPLRGTYRPLMKDDLPIIFLTRNSLRFVPSFLEHYRRMGVTRFLCVDDRSTDGTRERLLSEHDVENLLIGPKVSRGQWGNAMAKLVGQFVWHASLVS